MKKPLVIIAGPTGVGKSALAVALAKKINGAIISADSMQIYKGMDIGSAKITVDEMENIPHYLIDELSPEEEFNVVIFQKWGKQYLEKIYEKGQIPIIAGGTGFYIQALLYDIDFSNEEDHLYRKVLEAQLKEEGPAYLHEQLAQIDPISAKNIHPNNSKRVIRALEYYAHTNTPISLHNEKERKKVSPYNYLFFVLTDERKVLYEKIDQRVDLMMSMGLVNEVSQLKEKGYHASMVSMQGLGYKEILAYLDQKITLDEAVALIKRDTRHFAKRQLTWFKREALVHWIDKNKFQQKQDLIIEFMLEKLHEQNMI